LEVVGVSGQSTDGTDRDEWEFEEGDVIRERHEPHAPGGVALGKTEYKIERQLRQESGGKRFYHVEKQKGGSHLYSAGAIEGRYDVIDASESEKFSKETNRQESGEEGSA
jgi:hypothetical protein